MRTSILITTLFAIGLFFLLSIDDAKAQQKEKGGTVVVPKDPPKKDPPKNDPPKQTPPKKDPPKNDPPKQDPPKTKIPDIKLPDKDPNWDGRRKPYASSSVVTLESTHCPDGYFLSWEDEKNYYCEPLKGREYAAELMKLFETVSRNLNLPKGTAKDRELSSLNCQAFFRGIAQQLATNSKQSWVNDFSPQMNADQIAEKIANMANNGNKWEEIVLSTAPKSLGDIISKANSGVIIVGVMQANGGEHGHLGFVSPIPSTIKLEDFKGDGPFVRDGNEHNLKDKIYPSTYGAVRASKAFKLSQTHWYIWKPSKQ